MSPPRSHVPWARVRTDISRRWRRGGKEGQFNRQTETEKFRTCGWEGKEWGEGEKGECGESGRSSDGGECGEEGQCDGLDVFEEKRRISAGKGGRRRRGRRGCWRVCDEARVFG